MVGANFLLATASHNDTFATRGEAERGGRVYQRFEYLLSFLFLTFCNFSAFSFFPVFSSQINFDPLIPF